MFLFSKCHRCREVGTAMADKLIKKLSLQNRTRITLEVRETNLPGQLFWRAKGFRAVSVLRDYYEETPEDAYIMQYRYRPPMESVEELPTGALTWRRA